MAVEPTATTAEADFDREDVNIAAAATAATKPINTILLDTSPILLNTPSISTLIANSHELVTTQSVLDEIRGEEARNRLETLYRPFLTVRSPKSSSIKVMQEFARKTGDGIVLSATDFEILALAYDLECEKNGGDWRLRSTPGQKRLNGSPPVKESDVPSVTEQQGEDRPEIDGMVNGVETKLEGVSLNNTTVHEEPVTFGETYQDRRLDVQSDAPITLDESESTPIATQTEDFTVEIIAEESSSESEDGWITPSNIKKHQARENSAANNTKTEHKVLQVATITGDFAMQNVLLQMNLNLLSTKTCKRVAHIKQMIFRCHACFATTKDMSKHFCPRCGGPTLTRVTCTTNDKGEVKLHLKANNQWNNRGNVFSVPKPTHSSANQKWKGPRHGGGKGGWGNDLILAEDQKEYTRATTNARRTKTKDLMNEDMLPSILTGQRDQSSGKIKVGAGRNVNSRKR